MSLSDCLCRFNQGAENHPLALSALRTVSLAGAKAVPGSSAFSTCNSLSGSSIVIDKYLGNNPIPPQGSEGAKVSSPLVNQGAPWKGGTERNVRIWRINSSFLSAAWLLLTLKVKKWFLPAKTGLFGNSGECQPGTSQLWQNHIGMSGG